MGFIHIDVDVANPANPDVSESVRVLVDTGATLSILPEDMLDRLGIRRIQKRRLRGFGGTVTRDIGIAAMSYDGAESGVTVVFGAMGDPPIMGVTALETLGFEVDPVNGRLNRVDMLVMSGRVSNQPVQAPPYGRRTRALPLRRTAPSAPR